VQNFYTSQYLGGGSAYPPAPLNDATDIVYVYANRRVPESGLVDEAVVVVSDQQDAGMSSAGRALVRQQVGVGQTHAQCQLTSARR